MIIPYLSNSLYDMDRRSPFFRNPEGRHEYTAGQSPPRIGPPRPAGAPPPRPLPGAAERLTSCLPPSPLLLHPSRFIRRDEGDTSRDVCRMTSEQNQELALTLYAVVFEGDEIAELEVWHRCLHACQGRDVEPPTAMLISKALTGYLDDRDRPRTPLVTPLAKAQTGRGWRASVGGRRRALEGNVHLHLA
jgi:hypothetical protein